MRNSRAHAEAIAVSDALEVPHDIAYDVDAPLRPTPTDMGLDIANAVEWDAESGHRAYVVAAAEGSRYVKVSPTVLTLLRAAHDGRSASDVARGMGSPERVDEVAEAYQRLCRRLQVRGPATISRRLLWGQIQFASPTLVRAVTVRMLWAYRARVVLVVIAAACVVPWALFRDPVPTGSAVDVLLATVGLLLVLLVHEVGHATATMRGGVDPGGIGGVIYIFWPALYSDVTRSWMLSRRARMLVDVGGVYFQVAITEVLALAYAVTGWATFGRITAVSLASLFMTLNPFLRFDGHWLLADALGVANLYRSAWAALVGVVRRRPGEMAPGRRWLLALFAVAMGFAWGGLLFWSCRRATSGLRHLPHNVSVLAHHLQLSTATPVLMEMFYLLIMFVSGWRLVRACLASLRRRNSSGGDRS